MKKKWWLVDTYDFGDPVVGGYETKTKAQTAKNCLAQYYNPVDLFIVRADSHEAARQRALNPAQAK